MARWFFWVADGRGMYPSLRWWAHSVAEASRMRHEHRRRGVWGGGGGYWLLPDEVWALGHGMKRGRRLLGDCNSSHTSMSASRNGPPASCAPSPCIPPPRGRGYNTHTTRHARPPAAAAAPEIHIPGRPRSMDDHWRRCCATWRGQDAGARKRADGTLCPPCDALEHARAQRGGGFESHVSRHARAGPRSGAHLCRARSGA